MSQEFNASLDGPAVLDELRFRNHGGNDKEKEGEDSKGDRDRDTCSILVQVVSGWVKRNKRRFARKERHGKQTSLSEVLLTRHEPNKARDSSPTRKICRLYFSLLHSGPLRRRHELYFHSLLHGPQPHFPAVVLRKTPNDPSSLSCGPCRSSFPQCE